MNQNSAARGSVLYNISDLISAMNLSAGMKVADFGCGNLGTFCIPAARAVRNSGHVYGVDVVKRHLEEVKRRAHAQGFANVSAIWSDIEQVGATRIDPSSLDAVLIMNTLHQSKRHAQVLREAKRLLKPRGLLAVVDWKEATSTSVLGPHRAHRVDPRALRALAESLGFAFEREVACGAHHFTFLFRLSSHGA